MSAGSRCLPQSSFHSGNRVGRGIHVLLVLDTVAPIFETWKVVDRETPRGSPAYVPFDAQQILAEFDAKETQLSPVFTPANRINRKRKIRTW